MTTDCPDCGKRLKYDKVEDAYRCDNCRIFLRYSVMRWWAWDIDEKGEEQCPEEANARGRDASHFHQAVSNNG